MSTPMIVILCPILNPRYLLINFATISIPPLDAFMLNKTACPAPTTIMKHTRSITIFPDKDSTCGVSISKILRYIGSISDARTVFTPNSLPIKMYPMTNSIIFKTNVIVDTGNGMIFTRTRTSPDRLPSTRLFGIIS